MKNNFILLITIFLMAVGCKKEKNTANNNGKNNTILLHQLGKSGVTNDELVFALNVFAAIVNRRGTYDVE